MASVRNSVGSTIFLLLLFAGILWISWELSKPTKAVFEEARMRSRNGDWNGAIAGFTRVIVVDPNFFAAYIDRAIGERELKQYDKALSDCNRAIQINPTNSFAFTERGLSEAAKGDAGTAIPDCLHAIRLNPTNSYAFYSLGWVDCHLLNFDEAIECLTRAIELDPTNSTYYNNRGWAKFMKGDFDSSITDATRSIQLDPNRGYGYGTRAWARFGNGDVSGAVDDCKKSTQLSDPNSAPFFCDQGLLDFIAKDYKKAMADWQTAIGLDPDLKNVLQPWIEKARKSASGARYEPNSPSRPDSTALR